MRKLGVYSRLSGAGKVRGPEDCGLEREKRGLGTIWGHRGGGPRGPGFGVTWPRPSRPSHAAPPTGSPGSRPWHLARYCLPVSSAARRGQSALPQRRQRTAGSGQGFGRVRV